MMGAIPEETTGTKRRFAQDGFTLIELLVVIIILGILAAVAVFSVGGIGNTGQDSACKVDTQTLQTAEAAAFAKAREAEGKGRYAKESELLDQELLSDASPLHDIQGYVDNSYATPLAIATTTAYGAIKITVSEKGAESCVPENASDSDPCVVTASTLPETRQIVKTCQLGSDPDNRYPY